MIPVPIWLVTVAAGVVVIALIAIGVALTAWLDLLRTRAAMHERITRARFEATALLRPRPHGARSHLRPEDDDHDA